MHWHSCQWGGLQKVLNRPEWNLGYCRTFSRLAAQVRFPQWPIFLLQFRSFAQTIKKVARHGYQAGRAQVWQSFATPSCSQYAINPAYPLAQPGLKDGGCFVHSWTSANCSSTWTIWQYTSCGIAPKYGVPGNRLDLNVFRGTPSTFLDLIKGRWVPEIVDQMPKNEPTSLTYKNIKFSITRCSTHPHQVHFELLSEHGLVGYLFLFYLFFIFFKRNLIEANLSNNIFHYTSLIYLIVFFTPLLPGGAMFSTFNGALFWIIFSVANLNFNKKLH